MNSDGPNRPDNRLRQPLKQLLQELRGSDWWPLLQRWQQSAEGQALMTAVDGRVLAGAVVYPSDVFRALALTPAAAVKVVILGQDPYHGPGQAEGLAFSVPDGQPCPPSLRNIFKELQRDLGLPPAVTKTSLVPWARQGVLLLNSSLTVEKGQPGSHSRLGWRALTDDIVRTLYLGPRALVFMLWGAHAQACWPLGAATGGNTQSHLLLRSNHPSPLSALRGPVPYLGNGHFGLTNHWLSKQGNTAIDWRIHGS